MKFFIIGGSRFVGPQIIEMLLEGQHEVTVFNRGKISTNYPNGVRFVQGDRNLGFNVKEHFDAVIDTYAFGAAHSQQVIKELDFDFLLHFSTIAVYKKSEIFPFSEDHSPIGDWPLWSQNKSKVESEIALKESGIKYASIRPVYILGPRNYANRENFIYSAITNGKELVIPGNGEALAQFTFVGDVAKSAVLLATKQISGIYNCASKEQITLNGLVKEMGEIVGKEPIIKHNEQSDGDKFSPNEFPFPNVNVLCSTEKLEKLGIEFTPLLKGLRDDYESYYKGNLKIV